MQIPARTFLFGLALFSAPAGADFTAPLTLAEDRAQVVGSVYLPFEVALTAIPLGFRICAEDAIRAVTVDPAPAVPGKLVPEKGRDANCASFSGVQLSEDSTLTVEIGRGLNQRRAQAQIQVVDGFRPSRPFRLLRTDAERFVVLSWERGSDAGLICSNRSAALTGVRGKTFGSREEPASLAVVGGRTAPAAVGADWKPFGAFTCFTLSRFSALTSQEVWDIKFIFEDGARVRYAGELGS